MIKFNIDEDLKGLFPEPSRAGHYVPEYYKKLPLNFDDFPTGSGTAKKCIPFMEAMTSGYIIPLWSDIHINANDGEVETTFPEYFPMIEGVESHNYRQVQDNPGSNNPYYRNILKFVNPWIIETPPGVSCLFTTPMNHFETRFDLVKGVVDTDKYYNHINLPFVWTGGDGEFILKKNTPLVQVIPFVRYDFNKHKIGTIDNKRKNRTLFTIGTALSHGYRKYFWHKRKK